MGWTEDQFLSQDMAFINLLVSQWAKQAKDAEWAAANRANRA